MSTNTQRLTTNTVEMAHTRNQTIASSLSKCLSLDPEIFSGEVKKCDVKSLCVNILKKTQSGSSILTNDEAMKWIVFADNFPEDFKACTGALGDLNDALVKKSVLLGEGLKLSEVDVIVYSSIHPCIIAMSKSDRQKFPNVLRWMDYVQSKEDFGGILERISVEKARYEPQVHKGNTEVPPNSNSKDSAEGVKADAKGKDVAKGSKAANGPEADKASKKDSAAPSTKAKSAEAVSEVKKPAKEAAAKDEVPVTLLNIKVGLIRKAWKHPSADSLLVEEIDVGEPKVRQVVSGLAKYCSPDDLMNRRVVLITNVKPGKLRDVVSEGLVLCASNEDHSVVEPLLPPEGAVIGERVSFSGHEGKPEDVLNPKKKQFDKITPHLYTDDNGVATYKGIPFMTTGGPCTSSIAKASIK